MPRPVRTIWARFRRKLDYDAEDHAYIFNEPRGGYRMPKDEMAESEERILP